MMRWPQSLPFFVERRSYDEKPIMPRHSFQPDDGAPIERPKGSVVLGEIKCTLPIKVSQLQLFKNFVELDLNQGVDWFEVPHPLTREIVLAKFKGNPSPYGQKFKNPREVDISCVLLVKELV